MGLGGGVGTEHHLDEAGPVAQVHEHHAAVVAPPLHPAGEDQLAADQRLVDFPRALGPPQIPQGIQADQGPRGR